MDSIKAYELGKKNKGKEQMVFDWIKAANIIKDLKPSEVGAGLANDWDWTGGMIFKDGDIVPPEDTYTYLSSTWATPEIDVDGEIIDCFKMQSEVPDWDEKTYWPPEAVAILKGV